MKSNFALSLSFDGLRLMHRVQGGWHLVGEVALDNGDLTAALAALKSAADTLEPDGIVTKLLIPNDQIKYLAIDTTRSQEDDVREALHGATPYAVDELAYDYAKGGGRTYIAAVAQETLDEAQQFASEHGFNPVCFAAVPDPFTYVGEAFFGATKGNTAERDAEPVIVIGEAGVDIPPPAPPTVETPHTPPEQTGDNAEVAPAFEELTVLGEPEGSTGETVVEPEPEPEIITDEAEPEIVGDAVQNDIAPKDIVPEDRAPDGETEEPGTDAPDATPDPAPLFASRLRADRADGAPAAPEPLEPASRSEPTFSRKPGAQTQPALAVPTGKGTDAMPPLSAPSRDAAAVPVATKISARILEVEAAAPVTGAAPTARPPEAAAAAASLTVEPDAQDTAVDDTPETETRSAAATALGAASALGGAVGGMFASRRMARADAKTKEAGAPKADAKSRLTVFGARKKPKPKPVVGGKPRFLGLILTAVLLLFLLAIAAFAALSEEGIARWFGFGQSDTQIAADPQTPPSDDVAAATPDIIAPDALATPAQPSGGQVLSPEEATRIYAATGVWQRAPRIPQIPRTTSLETLALGISPRPVPRVPPSPLASASSVAGDALIAAPIDPPAPDTTFDFGADGLIVATENGAVTPDGTLIIAGPPPLNPPTRPGTIAPEITPQDQLAAVVSETAETLTDAPDGVIVISGRPAITPPIRTGTTAPAPALEAAALAAGTPPLVATDGLLVLAGSPPILPPVRPGTVAAPATPVLPDPVIEGPTVSDPTLPEGLNVVAGPPPILPPVRTGTLAPQTDAAVDALTSDITAALGLSTAQTPSADTARPLLRPAAIVQAAAAAAANTPILGGLTATGAASFRPRTRPAGLAPQPEPEPQEAAANRPNPIVNPTAQAIAQSARPDPRPRNMDRIVARAEQAQTRAATQVAAVAPRAVAPSGPTGGSVATNATLDNAINLRDINLIGIYGGSNDRRALVRLGNGRYVRVTVGDRLDGGRVTAISAGALRYDKRGRAITLEVAG